MNEQRVIIYISATKQTTTAKWHLEGMYPSDLWVAILHDISDLNPFLGESKVIIKFSDRTREAVFYFKLSFLFLNPSYILLRRCSGTGEVPKQ